MMEGFLGWGNLVSGKTEGCDGILESLLSRDGRVSWDWKYVKIELVGFSLE